MFDHPLKQYMLFREFEAQVQERNLSDIPEELSGNRHAQAYFGIFKKTFPDVLLISNDDAQTRWVALAFSMDEVVEKSVAENSINHQNIEADIRKKLLPMMFAECKACGGGMDQAKAIVEWIVQITRIGRLGN